MPLSKRKNTDAQQKHTILAQLNQWGKNTLLETLRIAFVDVGEDCLSATMPVGPQVHQPHGILHGGASVALGESVASALSNYVIDREKYYAVGVNIQANHLRPLRAGTVICQAVIKRKGPRMHYCEMTIHDEQQRLICAMSMNNIVLHSNRPDGKLWRLWRQSRICDA